MKYALIALLFTAASLLAQDNRYQNVLNQRTDTIDDVVEWLKPRAEDYREAAEGDQVLPGYSAFMTPEKIRLNRIANAVKYAEELKKGAMANLDESRTLKLGDTVNQVERSKVIDNYKRDNTLQDREQDNKLASEQRQAENADFKDRSEINLNLLRERTELAKKITEALKGEKDVEVIVGERGDIVVKKGRVPVQIQQTRRVPQEDPQ